MANYSDDLDRWTEQGLISAEQRAAILGFERERAGVADTVPDRPGRLANAISTVGAAIAILALLGLFTILDNDWTPGEVTVAALVGAAVMFAAGWLLVRDGWGAPAGLCAICGLVLVPVVLIAGSDAAGWWPNDDFREWDAVARDERVRAGVALLLAIPIGMATTRLELRQAWAGLPIALWFGGTLLVFEPYNAAAYGIVQILFGVAVAALATFIWDSSEGTGGSAWWLQVGGLLLVGSGVVFSSFDHGNGIAGVAALLAAGVFILGVVRGRTAWIVAGAVSAIVPVLRLTFDAFEGVAALLAVAAVGLAIALLPLVILRRRSAHSA